METLIDGQSFPPCLSLSWRALLRRCVSLLLFIRRLNSRVLESMTWSMYHPSAVRRGVYRMISPYIYDTAIVVYIQSRELLNTKHPADNQKIQNGDSLCPSATHKSFRLFTCVKSPGLSLHPALLDGWMYFSWKEWHNDHYNIKSNLLHGRL